jgi:hypothetical protein
MKTLIVASLFSLSMLPAQDVPPPPRPADGPSKEVTMKYIQDRLNSIDFSYTMRLTSFQETYRLKVSDAAADAQGCKLSFQVIETPTPPVFGGGPIEYRTAASFRDIGKLTVQPAGDSKMEFVPKVYVLNIKMAPGKTAHDHFRSTQDGKVTEGDREDDELPLHIFRDEELAQRMAKAIVHAVELCGGGDKDPFK